MVFFVFLLRFASAVFRMCCVRVSECVVERSIICMKLDSWMAMFLLKYINIYIFILRVIKSWLWCAAALSLAY